MEDACGSESENTLEYEGGRIFAGVLHEQVAVSSWGLLLSTWPWGCADVLWQQMKLQPSLRLAVAFSGWCCCRVCCFSSVCRLQGGVYSHTAAQTWIKGTSLSRVPAKPGQSCMRCGQCAVLPAGVQLSPARSSCAFLEGCRTQTVLAQFCLLSRNGFSALRWLTATRQLWLPPGAACLLSRLSWPCAGGVRGWETAGASAAWLAGRGRASEAEVAQVLVADTRLLC